MSIVYVDLTTNPWHKFNGGLANICDRKRPQVYESIMQVTFFANPDDHNHVVSQVEKNRRIAYLTSTPTHVLVNIYLCSL